MTAAQRGAGARVAFWHLHLPDCDPVCVLDSLGGDWGITYGVTSRLEQAERDLGEALALLRELVQAWGSSDSPPRYRFADALAHARAFLARHDAQPGEHP